MSARNVWIPDPLWREIQRAAAEQGAKEGRTVSPSEWLRDVAEDRISGRKRRSTRPKEKA